MRHGSLFSGIGGFDLAAQWMGWENVFHCEWNLFGQKVLNHYWPNAESFTDITKSDFKKYNGTIDIISGGFPCQPYSQAGKRKGKEDERHLWPEMLRAIIEVQPGWVVGENVYGLLNWNGGMVLDEIKTGLEGEGFEVFPPCVLPACGVNAPHRRDRVWIIAYSDSNRNRNIQRQNREKDSLPKLNRQALCTREFTGTDTGIIANTNGFLHEGRLEHGRYSKETRRSESENKQQRGWNENGQWIWTELGTSSENAANTGNQGLQGSQINGSIRSIRPERTVCRITSTRLARVPNSIPALWQR